MTCSRGDLVLVPFPFSDLSAQKRRPVICLTEADGFGDFLAAAVTTKSQHPYAVAINQADVAQGHLPLASWVRVDRLITLNQFLAIKCFGTVSDSFLARIIAEVCSRVEAHRPRVRKGTSTR